METSNVINEIAAALSKAQGAMGGAVKDSANPFFKSKYADLESVWQACRAPLASNGLAVVQTVNAGELGIGITTMLTHTSGQWIKDTMIIHPKDDSPQALGSAVTYARRYALAAIAGVYQTDDDGESAQGRHKDEDQKVERATHTKAAEYAERIIKAVQDGNENLMWEIHEELNPEPIFYGLVGTKMPVPVRRSFKENIDQQRAARRNGAQA